MALLAAWQKFSSKEPRNSFLVFGGSSITPSPPLRCFISSVHSWILSFLLKQELMWQKGVVFYSTWLPLSFVTFQGSKWPQGVSEQIRGEKSKQKYFEGAWECLTWRKHRSGDPPPCWLCLLGQSAVHANNPHTPGPPSPTLQTFLLNILDSNRKFMLLWHQFFL